MSESSAVALIAGRETVSFRDMSRTPTRSSALAIGRALAALLLAMGCAGPATDAPPRLVALADEAFAAAAPHGHAHNDYLHGRALQDALAAGCRSVEADVFLEDGALLVGHDRWMLRAHRSLRRLYLEPLRARVQERGGSVHGDGLPFVLLVDLKQGGGEVLAALTRELADFAPMLTRVRGDDVEPGAVTVVLSGSRPEANAIGGGERWFAIDGRLRDLDSDAPSSAVPLVSEPWTRHFTWDGFGPMDEPEREKLADLVRRARARGRWLRFWGAPDRPETWDLWRECGGIWIHTDRLRDFAAWRAQRDAR